MKSALATQNMDEAKMAICAPSVSQNDEGEILRLIKRHQDTGCARSLDRLVRMYHAMCLSFGQKYKHRFEIDDTYQDAMESLIHCVRDFDTAAGHRFFSYAYIRVKRELSLKKILQWSDVSVPQTKGYLKAFRHMAAMRDYVEMTASLAESIAAKLDVQVWHVTAAHNIYRMGEVSLDTPTNDNGGTLLDTLAHDLSPEEIVIALDLEQNTQEKAKKALAALTPKEAQVIQLRHLQEAPLTLREAGEQFGVSAERIRQIESAAIKKMKVAA